VVISNTATLTVNIPVVGIAPVIIIQPTGHGARLGRSTALAVMAFGSLPLTYHWQHLIGGFWINVGPSSPVLTINR